MRPELHPPVAMLPTYWKRRNDFSVLAKISTRLHAKLRLATATFQSGIDVVQVWFICDKSSSAFVSLPILKKRDEEEEEDAVKH